MNLTFSHFLFLSSLFLLLSSAAADQPCSTTSPATNSTGDLDLVQKAFRYVSGFSTSLISSAAVVSSSCTASPAVTELNLSSKNLGGAVLWQFLRNLTSLRVLDLSNNSLKGSVPRSFWSHPSLRRLDLSNNHLGGSLAFFPVLSGSNSSFQVLSISYNRFTHYVNLSGFSNLKSLDLSHNNLRALPPGLAGLARLQRLDISNCNISDSLKPISGLKSLNYLDVSNNHLRGVFPSEFPPLIRLKFLNVSNNDFTGRIQTDKYRSFDPKSFSQSGIRVLRGNSTTAKSNSNNTSPSSSRLHHQSSAPTKPKAKQISSRGNREDKKHRSSIWKNRKLVTGLSVGVSGLVVLVAIGAFCCIGMRKIRGTRRTKWSISKPIIQPSFKMERSGPFSFETESGSSWVADIREPGSAPVVMFEKPLMNLSFKDLIAATSCFGKESQLAEGRCGPVYRGVLPGEIHVAIKVLESVRGVDQAEAVALFEELSRLRHPNLLPISGYCIAGTEKLIMCEFMSNGDLHGWLHGLPSGKPNVDDWSTDTWDYHETDDPETPPPQTPNSTGVLNWATRHRIGLGVARGLAYLHHAQTKPVVHGHLVPSNVLLADDLEPRISDFGLHRNRGNGTESTANDVYSFGLILFELITGRPVGSEETVMWARKLVKEGQSTKVLDSRMKVDSKSEIEMVECLRVGYLCTADVPGKRPTMQQVVGMLKDVQRASSSVQ